MNQSQVITIDAPVSGWNAFDSLDNMPPDAAIVLDNLIPGPGRVQTRPGTVEFWDSGIDAPLETVASLDSATDSRLVAAVAGGLWDITDPTVQVVPILANPGTYANDRWQTSNFRKADEVGIMLMCNGEDIAQVYTPRETSPLLSMNPVVDTLAVTADFIGVEVFKGRCYYWKDEDDAFYYTDAGAYQGDFNRFPLGAFVKQGGKLMIVTTWTQQDSGDGRDDFLVFAFSTGEILVYQGDDPGGIGFFEMVGRYSTAPILSVRGSDNYGADVVIMTRDGYVGLASIIQQGRTSDVPQFSRLIHDAIVKETAIRSDLFGWDCRLFSKAGLFLFNVPLSNDSYDQHVFNTVTQRWCRFRNINVNCFTPHQDRLFGGTNDGRVLTMLEGTSDEAAPIEFTCLYAFNPLGNPGVNKFLTAAQVLTTHSAPDYITMTGYADFEVPVITPVAVPASETQGTWSINPAQPAVELGSYWDADYWATNQTFTTKGWQNVSAYGYSVSLLVRFAKVNSVVSWRSTNLRFHSAGSQ